MKTSIVFSDWVVGQVRRLDAGPYLSGGYEAKKLLELAELNKDSLIELTEGHKGGIYNGPKFARVYHNHPGHSVDFLTTTGMMQADLSNLPKLKKKDAESKKLSYLKLERGTSLISCSGTIGRMAYVASGLDGVWSCQDMIKVKPNEGKVGSGYLYSFLNSKFGVPMVLSGTYGAVIKHIEPEHIQDMPVPRLTDKQEKEIDSLIKKSYQLRDQFQSELDQATALIFEKSGLKELEPHDWHLDESDKGFVASSVSFRSLRAWNYSKRAEYLQDKLKSTPHQLIGKICAGGRFSRGPRFKRVATDEGHGALLVGQKQGYWSRPEGKWISTARAPKDVFVDDETILISAQGGLGERVCFARPVFVTGNWTNHAFSEHFLRLVSGDSELSTAYIFAFLRSEFAFRCLRSFAIGSMQQDIHVDMLSEFPVPIIDKESTEKVESLIRSAHKAKDLADELEDKAIKLLEDTIEAAAPKH